jgi:predicted transcriptional regulator
MTKNQRAILYIVIHHGPISELQINKVCTCTYKEIHAALRTLKRDGTIDTDDDGRYFEAPRTDYSAAQYHSETL